MGFNSRTPHRAAPVRPTTPAQLPYANPEDLRRALKDLLVRPALRRGFSTGQLLVHVAYDRLLARVFTAPDPDAWMLKGAGGLLAR